MLEEIILATTSWPIGSDLLNPSPDFDQVLKIFLIVAAVLFVIGIILAILFPNVRGPPHNKSSLFDDDEPSYHQKFLKRNRKRRRERD